MFLKKMSQGRQNRYKVDRLFLVQFGKDVKHCVRFEVDALDFFTKLVIGACFKYNFIETEKNVK